jgi:hypothetical protein
MNPHVNNSKILVLFSIFIVCLTPVSAQYSEENFIRYTTKDGLSDNYITCLQQDDWGYIWIGTDNGLNRFDGHIFENYFQGQAPVNLPSNGIRKLFNFGDHQLGIVTQAGFKILNTKNYTVIDYSIPGNPAFSVHRNAVWDVKPVHDTGYLVTTSTGIYAFDKNRKLNFRFDAFTEKDALTTRMYYGQDIFNISHTEFLIYLRKNKAGLFKASGNTFREFNEQDTVYPVFRSYQLNRINWTSKLQLSGQEFIFMPAAVDSIVYYHLAQNKTVISAMPRDFGNWFNWESSMSIINDSVFAISHQTKGFYIFSINRKTGEITCHPERLLASYKVICLFTDKDERLWVGTTEGILQQKMKKKLITVFSYNDLPAEPAIAYISGGFRYKNKFYLLRFSRSTGLVILDTATMKPEKQFSFFGTNSPWNEVRSIQMYHPDTLWLGTNAGTIWFDTRSQRYGKLSELPPYAGLNDFAWLMAPPRSDGYAWLSGFLSGVVARYHIASRTFTFYTSITTPALPFNKTKHIVYDAYGDVWISGHALTRWNNKKQLFDTLITVYEGQNKYNDDILTISADASGSLWLHNAFNGLLEYNIKEKKIFVYGMADGLPSIEIRCLSPVSDSVLWMASNNYLTRFDTRTKKTAVYDYKDGFPDKRPTSRIIYLDQPAGFYYFFCENMIARFPVNPEIYSSGNYSLLPEELFINNRKKILYPESDLRLNPNTENLTLRFTVIDFEKGGDYIFYYKLNNAETWTNIGGQRQINLSGLPSGNYNIQIKSVNKSGDVQQITYTFSIAPPYWKTSWFISGIIILIVSLAYLLYRYRIRQIRQKVILDKLLSQTEMKALHSQMNPHFIFNSLNSIREMILSNENQKASKYLSKFARLIRLTLDQSSQPLVTLQNTVEYLNSYIEMEQIRNNRFLFSIQVDEALNRNETVLPPMLIQPFIENAIWHGTNGKSDTISIVVSFKKKGDSLLCTIDDNGMGIDESLNNKSNSEKLHNPVGIANIQNRISLLNEKYGLQSSITIEDKSRNKEAQETGTRITLELPINLSDV